MNFTTNDIQALKSQLQDIGYLNVANKPDSVLLGYLKAGAKELERKLKVPLDITEIFSDEPTPEELTALAGKPYKVEPGYDFEPNFFSVQKMGFLNLRVCPVVSITSIKLIHPSISPLGMDIPISWLRVDKKYGQLHVLPNGVMAITQFISLGAQDFGMRFGVGYTVPYMIRVHYSAGIDVAGGNYPEVESLIMQMASLQAIKQAFLPQSGSISADGLSESASIDTSKFAAGIDDDIAHLKQSLTGITWGVL